MSFNFEDSCNKEIDSFIDENFTYPDFEDSCNKEIDNFFDETFTHPDFGIVNDGIAEYIKTIDKYMKIRKVFYDTLKELISLSDIRTRTTNESLNILNSIYYTKIKLNKPVFELTLDKMIEEAYKNESFEDLELKQKLEKLIKQTML